MSTLLLEGSVRYIKWPVYSFFVSKPFLYHISLPSFVATPADVSLLMQLGVDGVFVGSGIFKSDNPEKRAKAMVQAVTHYNDPKLLADVSEDLGEPMVGGACYQWPHWIDSMQ